MTGLEKALINRMVRDLTGEVSPQGQSAFTEAWYLKNEYRMLQAAVVWHLHQRLSLLEYSPAQLLIHVFEIYRQQVTKPLLDIGRVAYVSRLVALGTWQARDCRYCRVIYLASATHAKDTCPGCRLYYRFRCPNCGMAYNAKSTGRLRTLCQHCHFPNTASTSTSSRKAHDETK